MTRVVFYHAAPAWSGRARAFAAAAAGLAARGADVTFVCSPESAVEERLRADLYRVVPADSTGAWPIAGWRLRRAFAGAIVVVHERREAFVAGAAGRISGELSRVVVRVPAGGSAGVREWGIARRLAAMSSLYTTAADRAAAADDERAPVAELGLDVATHDVARPVARVSIGAGASTRLVACVCSVEERPRVANVLRTVALLAPRHPELRLVLVGPGSDDEDLRMHAAALGLARVVGHLGERDDRLSVLRAADVGWVAAGGDEAAFGFLDFMALRVPVLAERGPLAAHYVADGITGVLLPGGDAAATAAAIAPFLANDDARTAMGNAGRARVAREFSEAAFVDAVAAALAAVHATGAPR